MRRFLQLNPYDFIRFVRSEGCLVKKPSGGLSAVWRAEEPETVILVRMGEPIQPEVIVEYLEGLGIPEGALESYLRRPRRS